MAGQIYGKGLLEKVKPMASQKGKTKQKHCFCQQKRCFCYQNHSFCSKNTVLCLETLFLLEKTLVFILTIRLAIYVHLLKIHLYP